MNKIKLLSLIIVILMILSVFCGCGSSESDNLNDRKSLDIFGESSDGEIIESSNDSTGGNFIDDFLDDNEAMDSYPEYHIMEYLKNTEETPIILYQTSDQKLTKNSVINAVYIFKNGKCRKLYNRHSYVNERDDIVLGDLAKMGDAEIISKIESIYLEDLTAAIDKWSSLDYMDWENRAPNGAPIHFSLENELERGKARLYKADYFDFESYVITDDSGNYVEKQVLVLPVSGIGDNPYVLYYPAHDDSPTYFMNYFNTYSDDDSPWMVKFSEEYFGTGYGTKSDINLINELLCISNKNVITGGVYDSIYYGYQTLDSEWTYESGTVFFRHPDAYVLDMQLDEMNSEYVSYIDPKSDELLRVSNKYYNWYYNSLTSMSAYIGSDGNLKEDAEHDHQFEYESDWEHHWNSCNCGYKDIPLKHTFGGYETTQQPTCTEYGEQQRTCGKCGYIETTSLRPTHQFENGYCTICGMERESEGLKYSEGESTCSVKGIGSCTDSEVFIPSMHNQKKVTQISEWAFCGNDDIQTVHISKNVTLIDHRSFQGCDGLVSVYINCENSATIGERAFDACESLTNVSIAKGVTSIEKCAFQDCESLTEIFIPDSVVYMGEDVFCGTSITDIYCEAKEKPIGWDSSWLSGREKYITIHWGS